MNPERTAWRTTAPQHVMRLVDYFETLRREDVARMNQHYATHAHFKDPFNDLQGLPAVQRAFEHMFDTLDEPRFVILEALVDGRRCALTWDFTFRRKGLAKPYHVHGLTWFVFDADNKVIDHIDYWDAASGIYAKLPLIGGLIRWITKRLAVPLV